MPIFFILQKTYLQNNIRHFIQSASMSISLNNYKENSIVNPNKYYVYDLTNPFSDKYPIPYNLSTYTSEYVSLTRDLRNDKNFNYQQMVNQQQYLQKKQRQNYEYLYGDKKNSSAPFGVVKSRLIQGNPFLQGEPDSIKQLKSRHSHAKMQFNLKYQKEKNQKQQRNLIQKKNQMEIKQILNQKQFKTMMQLKNLEEYRKIKQAQKLRKENQQQRRNLMNVNLHNQHHGQPLFSFGLDSQKKMGLRLSSKYSRSNQEDQAGLRVTFDKNQSGFYQVKKPPAYKRSSPALSKKRSSGEAPQKLTIKKKVFYLIQF